MKHKTNRIKPSPDVPDQKHSTFMNYLRIFVAIILFSTGLLTLGNTQNQGITMEKSDSLTLDDIIRFAIQNNPDVRNSQLDQLSNEANIKEITSQGLPQITGSGGYNNNYALPQQIIPGEIFGQPGTLIPVKFGVQNSLSASVQMNQMIYNPSFWVGLEAAKTSKDLYKLATFKTKEELVYQIIQAYYQYQITDEQRSILMDNLNTMDKLIDIAEVQYEEGIIKKLDVDQLKVNKINLYSQIQGTTVGLTQINNLLKFLMGIPQEQELVLKKDRLTVGDFAEQEKLDLNNNIDLKLLDIQRELTDLELKNIKAGYIPSLSFYINYGWMGQTDRLFSDEEVHDIVGSGIGTFGLSLNVPIFDSF